MERIKFNSQEEFAEAMIKNVLKDEDGILYSWEPSEYPRESFRVKIGDESNDPLMSFWSNWKTSTFTIVKKSRFPDKAYVWAWNNTPYNAKLRFFDAKNDCTFDSDLKRGGFTYDNYELFTGTPLKHMEEMKNKLED